jgi:hypothetical protein
MALADTEIQGGIGHAVHDWRANRNPGGDQFGTIGYNNLPERRLHTTIEHVSHDHVIARMKSRIFG